MKNQTANSPLQAISEESLAGENRRFAGSGGISASNRQQGFVPAFLDTDTGTVYRSRFPDGRPAPVHMLSGLPEELLETGSRSGKQRIIKHSVISGFILAGAFYTRDEAARTVNPANRLH